MKKTLCILSLLMITQFSFAESEGVCWISGASNINDPSETLVNCKKGDIISVYTDRKGFIGSLYGLAAQVCELDSIHFIRISEREARLICEYHGEVRVRRR